MNVPKYKEADDVMVQRHIVQLNDYFPGGKVPRDRTLPPPTTTSIPNCGKKRQRVADGSRGQIETPSTKQVPLTTIASADPLVSLLIAPSPRQEDHPTTEDTKGASSSTPLALVGSTPSSWVRGLFLLPQS